MSPPLPYDEIVAFVRANLARRLTLDDLAVVAQMSVFQLVRAFRRETATTPYRLILDLRVDHAKRLLEGGAPIAEAACAAGFADQSHLTRHFRRRTGSTPKRYAVAVQAAA